MTRTTRTQLDELARTLSERHNAEIWVQHSGTGYAIRQTVGGSTAAAWEHACCLTASEAKQWLAGALAVHSITRRATDPAAF
jgi:hypothetical protein